MKETHIAIFLCIVIVVAVLGAVTSEVTPTAPQEVSLPEPTNYVVDTTGTLQQETIDTLNEQLKDFDSSAQIAVVVIETTRPLTIEQYSIKLADKWKVGDKEKDNGVIIVLATKDRKVRIEVGQGLEGIIPDAKAGEIVTSVMIPHLKQDMWDDAIKAGVLSLQNIIINN